MKPDLCLFGEDIPRGIIKGKGKYISHFGFAEFFVEIKAKAKKHDPFIDIPKGADPAYHTFIKEDDSENTIAKNLGQIVAYAAELCARQHQTHCFSISIYGTTARFIRWDRAGAIVSTSFDYKHDPEWLCRFFWRYSQATDTQCGYDITVTRATLEEEQIFKAEVIKHIQTQLNISNDGVNDRALDHYEEHAVFKIPICPQQPPRLKAQYTRASENPEATHTGAGGCLKDSDRMPWDEAWEEEAFGISSGNKIDDDTSISSSVITPNTVEAVQLDKTLRSECHKYSAVQYFLVSRPVAAPLSVASRGTRGYWSVKLPDATQNETEYQIAFLKDTWHIEAEDMEKEGEIMVEMVEAGVKFVSDIYCHGDVSSETSISDCVSQSLTKEITNRSTQTQFIIVPNLTSIFPRSEHQNQCVHSHRVELQLETDHASCPLQNGIIRSRIPLEYFPGNKGINPWEQVWISRHVRLHVTSRI